MMCRFVREFFDVSTIHRFEWLYFANATAIVSFGLQVRSETAGAAGAGLHLYGLGFAVLSMAALLLALFGPDEIRPWEKGKTNDDV